jgi:hypothetical protein
VLDLRVELGRRAPLLGGLPRRPTTIRVERPLVADLDGLLATVVAHRGAAAVRRFDATWAPAEGPGGLERALERLARDAVRAARGRTEVIVVSDATSSLDRLPVPSVLAVGAVHAELVRAGLRGRTDVVADAGDVLDVHALGMLLAAGATVVRPWLAIEAATELAGTRGAEDVTPAAATESLLDAFAAGLRKTLARMGISAVSS